MPRSKTGNPVGRRPRYSEDERPVTVSLRIPHDLAQRMKRDASLHRQSITEILLDGLRWRLGDGEYYGNTETSAEVLSEPAHAAVLEEIRASVVRQETQLHALALAVAQRPLVSPHESYYGNTTKGPSHQQRAPESMHSSNTVLRDDEQGAQPPAMPDKAALIARLHQMKATGMSLAQMARQLQADGLPTLSGKGQWQKGTVDKLLHQ